MNCLVKFFLDIYRYVYKLNGRIYTDRRRQILAQKQLLTRISNVLPYTAYSKDLSVKREPNPLTHIRNLPLQTYEEIYPWIERAYNGERDVLWPGQVKWFSKSSGTTNARSKYIPVTHESIHENHLRAGRHMLAYYLQMNPKSKLTLGSIATISGSIQEESPANARVGDISAVVDCNLPIWAKLTKGIPKKILEIKSWDERLPQAVAHLSKKDIRCLVGVTSWLLVLIEQTIQKAGKNNALELWPNLEVIFHGGVSIAPYRKKLKMIIPKYDLYLIEVFNASEGFFAFQDTAEDTRGLLLACKHGIWYEFRDLKTNHTCTISEIELSKKYELIITTLSGLWRYRTGDVVEVSSLEPIRIKVAGRTKAVLNTFGEEVMVGNIDTVIGLLNEKNYQIGEYTGTTIFPSETQKGGHEWIIETDNVQKENLSNFIEEFDNLLKKTNSDYEAKRRGDIILSAPEIHVVKKGVFNQWLAKRGKAGGQNKVPRLSENRELFEILLDFIHKD
ncbi:MAG: GH3 auxin-responsive promoter family protein [Candidatus Paceibacterota bacterium]